MKTLYKSSKLVALIVVGVMLMAAGTAVAVSQDRKAHQESVGRTSSPELIGRFVVTPTKATYIASSSVSLAR